MTDEFLRQELDSDQYAAVTAPLKNCLCIANAGSGKTRTLVYRIAHWIDEGEPEDSFLMLTFTTKAANEMMGRIKKLLGRQQIRIVGGTFHSVALRFLKQYVSHTEWGRGFLVLDDHDAAGLMRLCREKVCAELGIERKSFIDTDEICSLYSYSRNCLIDLRGHMIYHGYDPGQIDAVMDIIKEYEARKRKSNTMDFDDLLEQLNLILSDPDVAARIRSKYLNVFVDEYQDINDLQNAIIHKLVRGVNRLTVVGDEAQCIYGFRGSQVEYIWRFASDYPDVSVFSIRNNYRSTEAIVKSALSVINESPVYDAKKKEMLANFRTPAKVGFSDSRTDWEQAEYIADKILRLHRDEGIPFGNIAILSRTNTLPKIIETVLTDCCIPVTMNCGIPFFDRKHIRIMMSYLRFVHNPSNEIAFWELFSTVEGIGPVTVKKMFAAFDDTGFDIKKLESLKTPSRSVLGFNRVVTAIRCGFDYCNDKKAAGGTLQSLADIFFESYFKARMQEIYSDDWRERLTDIGILNQLLSKRTDLEEFLNNASLDGKGDPEQDGKVLITTVHKAKGLEWDVVFIPYVNNGVYPFCRSKTEEEVEEERRLLYVAMTRARNLLFLSSVRGSQFQFIDGKISHFLTPVMRDPRVSNFFGFG